MKNKGEFNPGIIIFFWMQYSYQIEFSQLWVDSDFIFSKLIAADKVTEMFQTWLITHVESSLPVKIWKSRKFVPKNCNQNFIVTLIQTRIPQLIVGYWFYNSLIYHWKGFGNLSDLISHHFRVITKFWIWYSSQIKFFQLWIDNDFIFFKLIAADKVTEIFQTWLITHLESYLPV